MTAVSELEQRRAVNCIWNAAHDYRFQPDFKAYDAEGRADLYLNIIIGALRRHYDYKKIAPLFAAFAAEEDADTYEGLLWLGLENCVYQREVRERPVLRALREDYARRCLSAYGSSVPDDYRLLDCLSFGHYRRVLGLDAGISRYDVKLLDELEFSPELDTDELVQRAKALYLRWFQLLAEEKKHEKHSFSLPFLHRHHHIPERYRKLGPGFVDHPKAVGRSLEPAGEKAPLRTHMSVEQLRTFMAGKFGKPLCAPQELLQLERELCTGSHQNCHLHLTRGESFTVHAQSAFAALQRQREEKQIEKNRLYYQERSAAGNAAVQKLAGAIQNSVLLHLRPSPVRSDTGLLEGGRVWRAAKLNDSRVFLRSEQDNLGDLSVDILLDASTSQQDRQEIVSSQGYLIAEALTRCRIPCRVMSFCSMTGFTVLRIFRDYNEPQRNDSIFGYLADGCNRDGLAIRLAHRLILSAPYEHRLLIVLSDVKPNDIIKIPSSGEEESVDYEKEAGIRDTAFEVRRARADGIAVVCVFTGADEDVPSARLVYGQDFARIQSLDRLADAVGKLIRNQLRNL